VERTKWFYSTDHIYESKLEDTLNDWGSRGWELVALTLIPPPKEADHRPLPRRVQDSRCIFQLRRRSGTLCGKHSN
jgi:hypothetical protein